MSDIKMSRLYYELVDELARHDATAGQMVSRHTFDSARTRALVATLPGRVAQTGVVGEILYIRGGSLHGWALDMADPTRKLDVQVVMAGQSVARVQAGGEVPLHLMKGAFPGPAPHFGFSIQIPKHLLKNRQGEIDVVVGEGELTLATNLNIYVGGARRRSTPFEGFSDPSNEGIAKGWVWNPEEPERRFNIAIFIDGKAVARGEAGLYREDLAHAHVGTGDHAFAIRIPPGTFTSTTRRIEYVVADNGLRLPGGPMLILDRHIFAPPKSAFRVLGDVILQRAGRIRNRRASRT